MTYLVLVLGVLVLVLLAVLLLGSRRRRRLTPRLPDQPLRLSPHAQLLKLQNSGRFRGVRIESHCRASSHLVGREFDFDAAPSLPVEGCDAAVCECGYVGLTDRRQLSERRAGEDRRDSVRTEWSDRRHNRPRRESDLNSWGAYGHL
jgi:hypothetical protein